MYSAEQFMMELILELQDSYQSDQIWDTFGWVGGGGVINTGKLRITYHSAKYN